MFQQNKGIHILPKKKKVYTGKHTPVLKVRKQQHIKLAYCVLNKSRKSVGKIIIT